MPMRRRSGKGTSNALAMLLYSRRVRPSGCLQWLFRGCEPRPKRKEFFELIGVTKIRTFINPTDPTSVALMMDVPDMEKFGVAMQSKDAADAMAHDGVLPETVVVCIEA